MKITVEMPPRVASFVSAASLAFIACADDAREPIVVTEDGVDLPLRDSDADQLEEFTDGDALFGLPFREADGLGPVLIRSSCGSCHEEGLRGPGFVQKMVIVDDDGATVEDQSALAHGHTVRPLVSGGGTQAVEPPSDGWPEGHSLLLTTRMPPTVLGRGYIEAVEDGEIERVEGEQAERTDGISGRIARVAYASARSVDTAFHSHAMGDDGLIGRFGLKARQATLDDFAADAFQGDMGLTSPLRPDEVPNPDGLTDDAKAGVDVDLEIVRSVTIYMRLIEIPNRDARAATDEALELFDATLCSACHVRALRTRDDYPIPQLAGIDAPIYSDVLLHDMGSAYGDGLSDQDASPTEWRTAPLIGLRFMRNYLHDGRASTVEDAIEMHDGPGSEAAESIARFRDLSDEDRATLVAFVETL